MPGLVKSAPASAITFAVYEAVTRVAMSSKTVAETNTEAEVTATNSKTYVKKKDA